MTFENAKTNYFQSLKTAENEKFSKTNRDRAREAAEAALKKYPQILEEKPKEEIKPKRKK